MNDTHPTNDQIDTTVSTEPDHNQPAAATPTTEPPAPGPPEDLAAKVHQLEQIVRGILIADRVANTTGTASAEGRDTNGTNADGATQPEAQTPVGRAGTAEPVQETAEKDRGGPWNWVGIDEERRGILAGELVAFVAWLEERYFRHLSAERFQLPANWYDNAVVVEVLTAVMVARQAAYSDLADAPSAALSEWHERALWPAIDRLQSLGIFRDNTLVPRTREPIAQHGGTGPLTQHAIASATALADAARPAETTNAGKPGDVNTGDAPSDANTVDEAESVTEPIPIIGTAH